MNIIRNMVAALNAGKPEAFLKAVQSYFAGVSYKMRMDNEQNHRRLADRSLTDQI